MGKHCIKYFLCLLILFIPFCALAQEEAGVSPDTRTNIEVREELVTLDYKDASLPAVLRALSYSYGLNLVATKDIQGKVTVNLTDVTVDEALEAILSVNGYAFTRKGNLIYITPGPGVEGIDKLTVSIHLSYLTAYEAQKLLTKVISSTGDIQVNESTNSLVVTDFPPNIEKMKKILQEIDIQPIQVLIEAKIVDIQAKALENFGTTYTLTYNPSGDAQGLFNRDSFADESLVTTTTMAGPSSSLSGGQLKITSIIKDLTAEMTIDALVQDNKAHLLASPSIATLNGKEARIIIGEKFPYKEKTQTTTGTTETTKFIDVGTTLKVTPMVSPDGWITMNVHPEVSSVSASLDAGPRITTREADATIRVRDKETIIIGGLINKKDDRIDGGIPYLRSIPLLGILFSKRSKDIEETELTVFITPHIIKTPAEIVKRKDVVEEEVYLDLEKINHLNLVDKLLEHARNLEREDTAESANKSKRLRNEERLNTYKLIVNQFPGSSNVDYALWMMGKIYYEYFREYDAATAALENLISQYPESQYIEQAQRILQRARSKEPPYEEKFIKALGSQEETSRQDHNPPAVNFGPRTN